MQQIKCVVVGDSGVGKTCLLVSFVSNSFPDEYLPSVFDGDREYTVDDRDTASKSEYDKYRVLAYPGTDVFLLCFSVVDPKSFENISTKWKPEIASHSPNASIVLVGLKADLAEHPEGGISPITSLQGELKAKEINAWKYISISALTSFHMLTMFDEAVRAVVTPVFPSNKSKRSCTLV